MDNGLTQGNLQNLIQSAVKNESSFQYSNRLDENGGSVQSNDNMRLKISSAQKSRGQLQQHTQMLSNRVGLLQQEYDRTNRRMQEMQKKMQFLIQTKQNIQISKLFKENLKKQREENLKRLTILNQQKKAEQLQKNELSKNRFQQRKLKSVQSMKNDQVIQKDLLNHMLTEIQSRNQFSTNFMRQQKQQWLSNRQSFFNNRRQYQQKLDNYVYQSECQKSQQIQDKYRTLEIKEAEILENLRKTQNMQRQVQSDFEKFISSSYALSPDKRLKASQLAYPKYKSMTQMTVGQNFGPTSTSLNMDGFSFKELKTPSLLNLPRDLTRLPQY